MIHINFKGSYAGIGSRKTPEDILKLIEKIGKFLSQKDMILRSGGAPGADLAFEKYTPEHLKEIYLPWKMFNKNKSKLFSPHPKAFDIAKKIHPNWNKCSQAAKKLHARNVHQILGPNLEEPTIPSHVNFVLYWAEKKGNIVQGGTATAVNLAKTLNIPTFNLLEIEIKRKWEDIIKEEKTIDKIKKSYQKIVKDSLKIN